MDVFATFPVTVRVRIIADNPNTASSLVIAKIMEDPTAFAHEAAKAIGFRDVMGMTVGWVDDDTSFGIIDVTGVEADSGEVVLEAGTESWNARTICKGKIEL